MSTYKLKPRDWATFPRYWNAEQCHQGKMKWIWLWRSTLPIIYTASITVSSAMNCSYYFCVFDTNFLLKTKKCKFPPFLWRTRESSGDEIHGCSVTWGSSNGDLLWELIEWNPFFWLVRLNDEFKRLKPASQCFVSWENSKTYSWKSGPSLGECVRYFLLYTPLVNQLP